METFAIELRTVPTLESIAQTGVQFLQLTVLLETPHALTHLLKKSAPKNSESRVSSTLILSVWVVNEELTKKFGSNSSMLWPEIPKILPTVTKSETQMTSS